MNKNLIIDSGFRDLLHELTPEEFEELEQNILEQGCKHPIETWNDIIVDGHNRYKICLKHNIEFQTIEMQFEDRDDVEIYMLRNQFSRRNSGLTQKVDLKEKLDERLSKRAMAKMQAGGANKYLGETGDPTQNICENTTDKRHNNEVNSKIGLELGISREQVNKCKKIIDFSKQADNKTLIELEAEKKLSVNKASEIAKALKPYLLEDTKQIDVTEVLDEIKANPKNADIMINIAKNIPKDSGKVDIKASIKAIKEKQEIYSEKANEIDRQMKWNKRFKKQLIDLCYLSDTEGFAEEVVNSINMEVDFKGADAWLENLKMVQRTIENLKAIERLLIQRTSSRGLKVVK